MSRRGWMAVAAMVLAVCLGLGVAWWLRTHERVEEEVDLPPIGEITYNPLYVLGLSLREAGWTVDMRQRLQPDETPLDTRDTVLLLNDPRRLSSADTAALLAFVASGGHLVLRTPPPEAFTPEANAPLLDALGVRPTGSNRCAPMQVAGEDPHVEFCAGQRFELAGEPLLAWRPTVEFETRFIEPGDDAETPGTGDAAAADALDEEAHGIDGDAPAAAPPGDQAGPATPAPRKRAPPPVAPGVEARKRADAARADGPREFARRFDGNAGTPGAAAGANAAADAKRTAGTDASPAAGGPLVFARLRHGEGSVDVLADLDFLTNDALAEPPHVTLVRQLLEPRHQAGTAHLLYAAEMPSLWRWLFENSWMAWGPALLALLAWLWARTARLGPLLPSPSSARRSLMEHVAASGEHDWRYGQGMVLHRAVREAFLARLRRRDPRLAALDGEVQAALLAERFGVSQAEVRNALSPPPSRDPAALQTRIALLIRLRNQL